MGTASLSTVAELNAQRGEKELDDYDSLLSSWPAAQPIPPVSRNRFESFWKARKPFW